MQLSAFPFSTILFDLDGTLVDSAPDVLEAITAVLRDAGDPVPRMELSIIGPPLEGIFREVCPDADETKIARHVAAFRDLYFGGTFPQSTPYLSGHRTPARTSARRWPPPVRRHA